MAVALCLPLAAQSTPALMANIPFNFELGDIILPAGEYRITHSLHLPGYVQLSKTDSKHGAMVLTGLKWPSAKQTGELYLSFNRYVDRNFLSDVVFWDRHCVAFKSKSERALVTSRMVNTSSVKPVEVKILASMH